MKWGVFCKKRKMVGVFCKKVENGFFCKKSGPFLNAGCIMYSISIFLFYILLILGGMYAPNAPPCLWAWETPYFHSSVEASVCCSRQTQRVNDGTAIWHPHTIHLLLLLYLLSVLYFCYRYIKRSSCMTYHLVVTVIRRPAARYRANGPITIAVRAGFEYDSSTIRHPTRSYVRSSNNEHVNSFALL